MGHECVCVCGCVPASHTYGFYILLYSDRSPGPQAWTLDWSERGSLEGRRGEKRLDLMKQVNMSLWF